MNDEPRLPRLPDGRPSGDPAEHPEAALAAYVDGSATPDERALVEAHLARCDACREELPMARAGRDALRALSQLPSPGLLDQILARAARGRDRPSEVIDLTPRRRRRWELAAAGMGVAAALVLAVVVLPRLFSGGGKSSLSSAPARENGAGARPAQPASPAPPLIDTGNSYNARSFAALGQSLAKEERSKGDFAVAPVPTRGVTGAVPAPAAPTASPRAKRQLSADAAALALACVERGAGLAPSTGAVYLEAAILNGRPVYIAAFRTNRQGSHPYLLIVAASREACTPLQIVSQRV